MIGHGLLGAQQAPSAAPSPAGRSTGELTAHRRCYYALSADAGGQCPPRRPVRPRERLTALAAVVLVQGALSSALLSGFRVDVSADARLAVERLIEIRLAQPPPRRAFSLSPPKVSATRSAMRKRRRRPRPHPGRLARAASRAQALSGSSARRRNRIRPTGSPAAGAGTGPAVGRGAGGGSGGNGDDAADNGGTEIGPDCRRDPAERLSQGTRQVRNRRTCRHRLHGRRDRARDPLPGDASSGVPNSTT